MVICIDEYLQKIRQRPFRAAENASPSADAALQTEDESPHNDPPPAVGLVA